jgi:hypothetical protein
VADHQPELGLPPKPGDARDAVHVAVVPLRARRALSPGDRVDADGDLATAGRPAVGIVDPFLTGPVEPGREYWLCLFPRTVTGMRHAWKHPAFPDEPAVGPVRYPAAAAARVALPKDEAAEFTAAGLYRDLTTRTPVPTELVEPLVRTLREAGHYGRPTAACRVRADAERWLREFAAQLQTPYTQVLLDAAAYRERGTVQDDGSEFHRTNLLAGAEPAFWVRYAVLTGDVPEDYHGHFYECGC